MPEANPPGLWADTSRWLEGALGLHFTPQQWPELQRRLELAARRLGLPDAAACAQLALGRGLEEAERQVLAECLTIGETYFFREPAVFEQLATQVLEPLIAARRAGTRHLRLWSAACASGEEAYSLAMLVARLLPEWREWNISILATDINEVALRKARAGAYGRWSLRGTLPPQARGFLHAGADGRFHVDADLRRLVRFAPLNLVSDDYPSAETLTTAMDLVLCRNVLIYFEPGRIRTVLARLGRSLADEGWLVTTAVEIPREPVPGLTLAGSDGLAALRRSRTASGLPPVPAPPPTPAWQMQPPRVAAVPAAAPLQWPEPAAPPPPAPVAAADATEAVPAAVLAEEARLCADAGDLARAEALCRRAIASDKLNAAWTFLLASILQERGALDAAVTALQRTLYLEPDHVLARFALGSLSMQRGHAQAGRRHFAQALARLASCGAREVVPGSGGLTVRDLEGVIRRMEAATT